jgi:hypothetical protein
MSSGRSVHEWREGVTRRRVRRAYSGSDGNRTAVTAAPGGVGPVGDSGRANAVADAGTTSMSSIGQPQRRFAEGVTYG